MKIHCAPNSWTGNFTPWALVGAKTSIMMLQKCTCQTKKNVSKSLWKKLVFIYYSLCTKNDGFSLKQINYLCVVIIILHYRRRGHTYASKGRINDKAKANNDGLCRRSGQAGMRNWGWVIWSYNMVKSPQSVWPSLCISLLITPVLSWWLLTDTHSGLGTRQPGRHSRPGREDPVVRHARCLNWCWEC